MPRLESKVENSGVTQLTSKTLMEWLLAKPKFGSKSSFAPGNLHSGFNMLPAGAAQPTNAYILK
jgi:hypothetical protein